MRFLFRGILLSTLIAPGCRAPVSAPASVRSVPTALPAVAVGRRYEFTLKSPTPTVTESYEGVVKEFDEASIVITGAARTVRREAEPLPRGPFGLGGRKFRNVGVGREALPGDLTVRRENLVSIAPLEPVDANAVERPAAP